ncbi:MAG TPA: DUF4349 domain-containing protein [Acidimicrobiales bacterium]|jgi:hypothetical protein
MTMLDDDRLSALFGRAAEAFEVPATGPDAILARAEAPARAAADGEAPDRDEKAGGVPDTEDELAPFAPGRGRRLAAMAGRHRVLSAAACLVVALVLAGAIAAAVRAPSTPTVTSGLKAARLPATHAGSAVPLTTTTLPGAAAQGPAFGSSTNASAGTSAGGATGGAPSGSATTNAPNTPALPSGSVGQPAKIEQTGTLGLTVGRGAVVRTMSRLNGLAGDYGGFVANSQTQSASGGNAASGTITLQVPVDNFTTVLKQAQRYGKTANVSTKASDVTSQYVDLQARLTALEASRQQYLTILAKATSIGDILSVQEQLDSIQSQIEQLQGQLQVLTSETSYSTLNVTVDASVSPPRPGPFPESGLVQAWHDSVGGFTAGVEGVIRLAGPFLFALLCLAIVAVGGRVLWRRFQRHRL